MTEGTSFKGIRWVAFGMIDPTTGLIQFRRVSDSAPAIQFPNMPTTLF